MFETPYQTTPCTRFDMGEIVAGVRKLEIEGKLLATDKPGIFVVPPSKVSAFHAFQQPLTKIQGPTFDADVIIDGRSLLRADGRPEKLDVYNHHVLVARLTQMWYQGDRSVKRDFLQTSDFLPTVFISWLGGAVGNKLLLDATQVQIFRMIVAVYYIQLHTPLTESSTAEDKLRLYTRAAKYLPKHITVMMLENLLGDPVPLNNIADFVLWAKQVIQSPRMDQLTPGYMYPFLNYSWGTAAREAVAVSLEYPPTFMALVYTTCLARSYTRTALGAVIDRVISMDSDRKYVKNVNHLIGGR